METTPERAWNTLFAGMQWEQWDPATVQLLDIKGGLVDGGTFRFQLNTPLKFASARLSNVTPNERFKFSGKAAYGLLSFYGLIELRPNGLDKTIIEYTFGLGGLVGTTLAVISYDKTLGDVQRGLDNMAAIVT